MDNSQEFAIVDIVIVFGGGEHLREICTRMEVTIVILLHQYPSAGQERGISHDDEGAMNVWKMKYRCGLELRQQEVEGCLLTWTPHPGLVFSHQGSEGSSCVGEIRDELAVEVTKAQEGVDGFNSFEQRPGCDSRQLGRVHTDTTTSNYHAKELDLHLTKFAF